MIPSVLLIICPPVLFVVLIGCYGHLLGDLVSVLSLTFLWAAFSRLGSSPLLHAGELK